MNSINSAQLNNRIILLYELTEKPDTVTRQKSRDDLWWGTVSEIFNYRKILFYNISETVTDMFLAYPQAIKLYHKETLIETPMVIYNGSDSNTAKYNAVFSIKKSNNESRYGPFYYFTDLYNAMRYACYDIETGEKNLKGGLVRFVIYPGKMKMFLKKINQIIQKWRSTCLVSILKKRILYNLEIMTVDGLDNITLHIMVHMKYLLENQPV